MKTKKIVCSGRKIELLEEIPEYYEEIAEKVNDMLKRLREGVSTWISAEKHREMNISIWIYNDERVNAFCCCIDENNYIALSVGLVFAFWNEAKEFVDQDSLSRVIKLSKENASHYIDALLFNMLNFAIAHEFGHIVHGHLKNSGCCERRIDEILIDENNDKHKNWISQLKEYDADSFAVTIQAILFLQRWKDDMKANLANFDTMYLANYLCFRTFAEKTGRTFDYYFEKDITEVDHPHPGIRMYYSLMVYAYWIGRKQGYTKDAIDIIYSGSHIVIAYEKQVLGKNEIKASYYSVGFTEKGSQHVMNLHNGWQEIIDEYNQYAYIPIEKLDNVDSLFFSLDENGNFLKK